jgi:DNA mismatch repair protein MutS
MLDRTVTAGGARLLERRVSGPATRPEDITRFATMPWNISSLTCGSETKFGPLSVSVPISNARLSRLALDRGGPRDLAALRDGLAQAAVIADRLPAADLPELLRARSDCLGHEALRDMLDAALVAEPPVQARDGGFIAPRS